MTSSESDWDEWLGTLHEEVRALAVQLREQYERLGAADPEELTRRELSDGTATPHLAGLLFVRSLWNHAINCWERHGATANPSGQRLLEAGAEEADLAEFARLIASHAVAETLYRIDEGGPLDGAPWWRLVDRDGDHISMLHELVLYTDPTWRSEHLM